MAADVGTGTAITFDSGFLGEILSIEPPNPSREVIDTSHMASANNARTFKPGDLVDWGELTAEISFHPSESPPITGAEEQVVITFPDTTTWTFQGFMSAYEPSVPLEDKMTATVTIKVSGPVTIASGS